ncbi:Pol polyprotein [Elysia marginata]|uniref:Pol polyprotein n=1 Tax=Elysia marginata TaxID=1093978 RepID=A0AAV4F986_9GAST|nr:Pol polyprotein [Elysia marginata]
MGIIRKSKSPWASSLHIVPKPNGGWRPCGDYRRLNDVTTPVRYPIPLIQDFSAQLSEPLDWSDVMTEAFSSSKTALVNVTMLTDPAHGAPIALTSDASDVEVGAVLEQLFNGWWQPLAFFSKQLRPAEKKYSTFDRELLGLYLAVKHFRYFLEGRRFAMFTDHKPLVGAMSKLSAPWTAR